MTKEGEKIAIIIGAGPAGLTAAYELLHHSDVKPIIMEMSDQVGGLSRTVDYKGNKMDIGGHRFFSKSEKVMEWWQNILPIQGAIPNPNGRDKVMLIRNRLSRIYFLRKFFDYPVSIGIRTLLNLGLFRTIRIVVSYIRARLFPIRKENSLEDFYINRFGRKLYKVFFKDYTHKVWGIPCDQIPPEWGAQRVKGLSVRKVVLHAIKGVFANESTIEQRNTETSLIEKFLYPKFGPGQMWEEVADIVEKKGGRIIRNRRVVEVRLTENHVSWVKVANTATNDLEEFKADYFLSTMPVKDLIHAMGSIVPDSVQKVAANLVYRDFITLGLLLDKLDVKGDGSNGLIGDNWIYIQDKEVKLGRIQIFNNWSPYLVKDASKVWLGLEYFCNEGDEMWSLSDEAFMELAIAELEKIGFAHASDVLDHHLIRVPKTYPSYFGAYNQFSVVRSFTDGIKNLFLIGRNGMHKYNNQDHSMLTAMEAVRNIIDGVCTKDNIWSVNTEQTYHEERSNK